MTDEERLDTLAGQVEDAAFAICWGNRTEETQRIAREALTAALKSLTDARGKLDELEGADGGEENA